MSLLRSTFVISCMTLISRLLGLIRDVLLASALGAGPVADAFFVAMRFPNLFRRLFAEGALASAFIPAYAQRLEQDSKKRADHFASEVISALLAFLLPFIIALQLLMPFILRYFAPGFVDDPSLFSKAILWTQITTPYLLFMSVLALISGMLNSRGHFALAAIAPVLLNLVMIFVLAVDWGGGAVLKAEYLTMGVLLAGILQAFLVYLGARNAGISLHWLIPRFTPAVRSVLLLSIPTAIAAGATQINLLVGQILASFEPGAISWLSYADRLYQLPLGLVGVAFGVALLPNLSRLLKSEQTERAEKLLDQGFEFSLILALPAALALWIGAEMIISALYERNQFDAIDRNNTATALKLYALGLPAFVMTKIFSPAFFARSDTKTPMFIAIGSMVVNILLGILLFHLYGFAGLALATSLAGWMNALLLAILLWRKGWWAPKIRQSGRLALILISTALMGGILYLWLHLTPGLLEEMSGGPLRALALWTAMGMAVYFAAICGLGVTGPKDLRQKFRRTSKD